jgi:hypothetical protein
VAVKYDVNSWSFRLDFGHSVKKPTCKTLSFYRDADKSLARPTSRCILFDASLVIYVNSTNIPPIMIINRIYETQNLLSL